MNAIQTQDAESYPAAEAGGQGEPEARLKLMQAANNELEARVAERTASLREAVAQMEEFTYTVSHDLRAPLRGMAAYCKALQDDYRELFEREPEALSYLRSISAKCERMDRMILGVLTFTRVSRQALPLERVDLDAMVRTLAQDHPPAAQACIRIEPLLPVRGHEPSLSQAVSNLLSNALKFARPGAQPSVRVRTEALQDRVRLWVEDDGIGVDPRHHGRLFKLFERIHPKLPYEGTGVGLAIVHRAVERMGGAVGVESEEGKGSRFWIELPAGEVR